MNKMFLSETKNVLTDEQCFILNHTSSTHFELTAAPEY